MTILAYASADTAIEATSLNGYGIRGADVPSVGGSGAAVIFESLSLPADNDKEYRFIVSSLPALGTLVLNEDTGATFTGPDGNHYLVGDLWEYDPATGNETEIGEITVTFLVGNPEIGQAAETDTAHPFVSRVSLALGQAVETDMAGPLAALLLRVIGQAIETDTAQVFTPTVIHTIGQAVETDSAQAFGARQTRTIGQANETDTAQAITPQLPGVLGPAIETDNAFALLAAHAKSIGQGIELDAAQSITGGAGQSINQAIETDIAQALAAALVAVLGIATEVDTALPVSFYSGVLQIGQAIETDSALALIVPTQPSLTVNLVVTLTPLVSLSAELAPAVTRLRVSLTRAVDLSVFTNR